MLLLVLHPDCKVNHFVRLLQEMKTEIFLKKIVILSLLHLSYLFTESYGVTIFLKIVT